ncbi:MAG: TauD/TfdA family dioxygenase [Hyphomonadaceae bacterium]|nr:TauD/TfdA family dioxygenase [Hyphomonadaceae bacterium]
MAVRKLDEHVAWRRQDMLDAKTWTVELSDDDQRELQAALEHAKQASADVLELGIDDFPLSGLKEKLAQMDHELLHGRGFVRLSALDGDQYSDEDLTLLYWGIGLHLGDPWPQNKYGHVLGDVINQGKAITDPTARGNELGSIALDFHTDGSDYVGLMCLHEAEQGGLSLVANAVAIHNEMVEQRPDLAEALYAPLPWDFRGEEAPGGAPYYMRAPFTEHDGRFFLFCVPQYIRASQRHPSAPRLTALELEALTMMEELARREDMHVAMPLRRGEMQFIYNYHVFHGRTEYRDPPVPAHPRHLKRLWLSSRSLTERPEHFALKSAPHWMQNRSASRMELRPG